MKPYAAWFEGRTEVPVLSRVATVDLSDVATRQFEDELYRLTETLIENLMTASAGQLRQALVLMVESSETQKKEAQHLLIQNELARIEERTTALVSEALVPVLQELQLSRVIAEFASILKKILPEFASQTLLINAPADVHGKVLNALQKEMIGADLIACDNAEISAVGNQVVLRADLRQWGMDLKVAAES